MKIQQTSNLPSEKTQETGPAEATPEVPPLLSPPSNDPLRSDFFGRTDMFGRETATAPQATPPPVMPPQSSVRKSPEQFRQGAPPQGSPTPARKKV